MVWLVRDDHSGTDVRDMAHIEGLRALPRLLALVATRSASLLNFAELSRSAGMPQST